MLQRLRSRLAERFWSKSFRDGGIRTWMAEPAARAAINRRVTGSPHRWPVEWLAEEIGHAPFDDAVSLGCGDGGLERDLARKGLARRILGLDLAEPALALARDRARDEGFDGLRYERADFNALRLPRGAHDAAFFHQSLHHVEDLEGCLDTVAASLRSGGLLYLDEYVGPSRGEWRHELLDHAEAALAELPPGVARRPRFRRRLPLPVDWRDPSEAIRSSEILTEVSRRFAITHRRDYGGNLLAVIHPHLRRDLPAGERTALVERLLEREDELLAAGAPSYYTVVVAKAR